MKSRIQLALLVALGLAAGSASSILVSEVTANEDTLRTVIPYQGTLTNNEGQPIDGTVTLSFRLHGPAGQPVWTDTFDDVVLRRGAFSVALGSKLALPAWAFNSSGAELEIGINGTWLAGRQALYSLPFSYLSLSASDLSVGSSLEVGDTFATGSLRAQGTIQAETFTTSADAAVTGNLTLGPTTAGGGTGTPPTGMIVDGTFRPSATVNLVGGSTISTSSDRFRLQGDAPFGVNFRLAGNSLDSSFYVTFIDHPDGAQILGPAGSSMTITRTSITRPTGGISFGLTNGSNGRIEIGAASGTSITRTNRALRGEVRGNTDTNGRASNFSQTVNLNLRATDGFCALSVVGIGARHHQFAECRTFVSNGNWLMRVEVNRDGSNSWDNGARCQAACFRY